MSFSYLITLSLTGIVKLGHPVPDSNFSVESNNSVSQQIHAYNPGRCASQYSPVPARSLQTLGEMLVEIHGQHAHQALLKRERQRELLDDYAGHREMLRELAACHRAWRSSEQQYQVLAQAEQA